MAKLALQGSNVFSTTFASISGAQNSGWIYIANNNPIFNIGGESWTIECWLKPTGNYGAENVFFRKGQGVTAIASYQGSLYQNGLISWYNGGGNTNGTRVTPNVWTHVAFVFNQGANVRIFLNGVNVATNTSVTSISNTDSSFTIGSPYNSSPYQYFGDISNFRIIKGQAIYSGESFNVSTLPMQLPNNAIGPHASGANVAASLTGNVIFLTCNDQYLKTNGNTTALNTFSTWGDVNFHAIDLKEMQTFSYYYPANNSGSPAVNSAGATVIATNPTNSLNLNTDFTMEMWYYPISSAPFGKALQGSVLFNGTNQYITSNVISTSAAFTIPAGGDFTIEGWFYIKDLSSVRYLWTLGTETTGRYNCGIGTNGVPFTNLFGSASTNYSDLTVVANTWNHIAFTRTGGPGLCQIYVNGIVSGTVDTQTGALGTGVIRIGSDGTGSSSFSGSISNFRVVNGVQVYNGKFTPPPQLTATQNASSFIQAITTQTVLLTCQNTSGSVYTDFSSNNVTLTGVNSPTNQQISEISGGIILERGLGGTGNNTASYILVWDTPNNNINFAVANANNTTYCLGSLSGPTGSLGSPTLNAWNHIAITRATNTWRGFLNGSLNLNVATNSNTPHPAYGRGLTIGGAWANGATYGASMPSNTINGYISNLRIIRGNSIYNAAFTPSTTSQLGNVTNTILLTGITPALEDLSGTHTLATNGQSQITFSPLNPITPRSVLNTNAANSSIISTQSQGLRVGRIYDKFDYNTFGIQAVIPPAAGVLMGRIYDKFDYNNFAMQSSIPATSGIKVGRIYDKFDYVNFAMQGDIFEPAGVKVSRIYDKFDTDNFAYIPTGGSSVAPNYQFWS